MAGYIGSKAVITSGVSASIDELNLIDGVTATTAELNYNDTGAAVGVVVASKTVTADANKDVASFRNITLTGELDAGSLDISGNADIDGTLETDALSIAGVAVTSTAAELNLIDGGTARGTTAIADGDGVLINDAGTMRQTSVETLATYMGTKGLGPTFTTAANSSAPSSPAVGDFWYNTTYAQLLQYFNKDGSNNNWHVINTFGQSIVLMNSPGLGYAVFLNSKTGTPVGLVSLSVVGETSAFWSDGFGNTISQGIHNTESARASSLSNTVRGLYIGGYNNNKSISFFNLAVNTGVAGDFGDLNMGGSMFAHAMDHATRGVISAGRSSFNDGTASSNEMDYVTIGTAGNATDFGNMTVAKGTLGCAESVTRGLMAGGMLDSNASVTNIIDYITIANTGNATDFGNLSEARHMTSGVTNGTRAVFLGGSNADTAGIGTYSTSTPTDVIDYVTIGSTGNATDFGNLIGAINPGPCCSTGVKGIAHLNTFTIATAANATSIDSIHAAFGVSTNIYDFEIFAGWIPATG